MRSACSATVELLGLFHARKLARPRARDRARLGHGPQALRLTKPFYDRFTPAIAASDFALRRRADLDARWTSSRLPGVSPAAREPGELALVLHTHMPYVEGFGTWPFGEEWLWEAIATSYLPLLDVLGATRRSRCR